MCGDPSSFPFVCIHLLTPWLGFSPLLPGVYLCYRAVLVHQDRVVWSGDHVWWDCCAAALSPLSPFRLNLSLSIYPHIYSLNFHVLLAVKRTWRIFRCVCYRTPTQCYLYGFLGCLCKAVAVARHCFYYK